MKTLGYTAVVWKEEKGYISKCPYQALLKMLLREKVEEELRMTK